MQSTNSSDPISFAIAVVSWGQNDARAAENNEDWDAAVQAYNQALEQLPADQTRTRWQLRLAAANARIYTGELPEAMIEMENLLADLLAARADSSRVQETRRNLATAQYYAAWLMRLEGATTEEWTAEVEQARQNFRLLAEQSLQDHNTTATLDDQRNLEATIRLARMDLSELQGLPLPSQCRGCKNCSQKCRKQRESKRRQPSEKEPKDARGAGVGQRPEGTGS